MKIALLSHDASGAINPVVYDTLLRFLPLVPTVAQADAVVVPVCNQKEYVFNPVLLHVNKPIIVIDFTEYGWDAGDRPNVLGTGAFCGFPALNTEEYEKLDTWVLTRKPVLHFKRELFLRDVSARLLPIEFTCRILAPPIQTKAEFDARPIEVFHYWGLSNPVRQRFHGDVFRHSHESSINIVDGWDQDGHFEGRTWATIHTPWYNRKPIEEVMRWNWRSKLSVSLPGAGEKCFRHSECPVGSIMIFPPDNLAWSYQWKSYENCVRVPFYEGTWWPESWWPESFNLGRLYDIYLASQDTIAKYRSENYVREYVLPAIDFHL